MAISGGAKPSISMRLVDGTLHTGVYAMRQGAENDPAKAAKRILKGETVYVQVYGSLVEQVKAEVLAALEVSA